MAFDIEKINRQVRNYALDVKQLMPIDKAVLFGSFAKGNATEFSDVDICFFLKDFNGKKRVELITELLGLGSKYPEVAFEPLVFSSSEIENGNPLINEILSEGIELF